MGCCLILWLVGRLVGWLAGCTAGWRGGGCVGVASGTEHSGVLFSNAVLVKPVLLTVNKGTNMTSIRCTSVENRSKDANFR